jgi:AraC-like DNA-binding protein
MKDQVSAADDRRSPRIVATDYAAGYAHFEQWREEFARRISRVEADTFDKRQFRISTRTLSLPSLSLAQNSGAAAQLMRTPDLLKDGNDAFHLTLCTAGQCEFRFEGEHIRLRPGQATLYTSNRAGGCVIEDDVSSLHVRIDRGVAGALTPAMEAAYLKDVKPGDPSLRIFSAYLHALLSTPDELSAAVATLADNQLRELLANIFSPTCDLARAAAYGGVKAARLQAILRTVEASLGDPQLNAERAGRQIGVSGRYVQQLMEGAGLSFSAYVRETRLDYAHRMLSDPLMANKRISDICYMAGFSELSHFNRAFRARFGQTPKDVRVSWRS